MLSPLNVLMIEDSDAVSVTHSGSVHRAPPAALCLAMLIGALSVGNSSATENDKFNVFASANYSHESNLFRLPDAQVGYGGVRDDNFRQLMAGFSFRENLGRQVFSVEAQASRASFDHFTQLDYTGKTGRFNWGWHLGNHVDGTAGVAYSETLAPYTDVVTNERNLRTEQHSFATAAWTFHPSWRARIGADHYRYKYDLLSQSLNNHRDDRGEVGVDYLAGSGSSIGGQINSLRRRYDMLRSFNGQAFDAGSDQTDLKLKVVWQATPVTLLQFLGGRSQRSYSSTNERDSRGVNARVSGSTMAAGKLRISGSVWREYAGVESSIASYSLNNGGNLSGNWTVTSKVQATVDAKYVRRRFEGLLASRLPQGLSDSTRTYSMGLNYAPLPQITLSTSVFREARSGVAFLGSGSYHANGVSFTGNLQY